MSYTIEINNVVATGAQVQDSVAKGHHDESVWADIVLPPDQLGDKKNAPDRVELIDGIDLFGFNGNNVVEELSGSFEIEHNYKEGTDLRPHIHWCPVNVNAGSVEWNMTYTVQSNVGDVYTSTETIVAVQASDGVDRKHQAVEFGVISGLGLRIGAVISFRLFRDPTDSQDTYGADALLLSLGIHYEIDGDGSNNVFSK